MDQTSSMYSAKQIYQFNQQIKLPDCMYNVKNIHRVKTDEVAIEDEAKSLEERQDKILSQLYLLKEQLNKIKSESGIVASKDVKSCPEIEEGKLVDIVISANPDYPPYSLLVMLKMMENDLKVGANCHVHSSLKTCPGDLTRFLNSAHERSNADVFVTLIWKQNDKIDPTMMISPITQVAIEGEVNILRFLSNFVHLPSKNLEAHHLTEVDAILDLIHGSVFHGNNKQRQSTLKTLNVQLGKTKWLAGSEPTIADIATWSALKQCHLIEDLPRNFTEWMNCLNSLLE